MMYVVTGLCSDASLCADHKGWFYFLCVIGLIYHNLQGHYNLYSYFDYIFCLVTKALKCGRPTGTILALEVHMKRNAWIDDKVFITFLSCSFWLNLPSMHWVGSILELCEKGFRVKRMLMNLGEVRHPDITVMTSCFTSLVNHWARCGRRLIIQFSYVITFTFPQCVASRSVFTVRH